MQGMPDHAKRYLEAVDGAHSHCRRTARKLVSILDAPPVPPDPAARALLRLLLRCGRWVANATLLASGAPTATEILLPGRAVIAVSFAHRRGGALLLGRR